MLDEQTQHFFTLLFDNLKQEIGRLSVLVENQGSTIRQIEITTTTRIAELQKDIASIATSQKKLEEDFKERANNIEKEEGLRQAADITISNNFDKKLAELRSEFTTYIAADTIRWTNQVELNGNVRLIGRLLWAILIIFIGMLATLLWNIYIGGGIQNLAK